METIKIKIEKVAKINQGVLYIWYRATNTDTLEVRDSISSEYYGDDIINIGPFSEQELNEMEVIFGKKYSNAKIISSEIREYSSDNAYEELEKEGWSNEIHKAIEYVIY